MHIKRDNAYRTWTYADFHRDINKCVSAIKKTGLQSEGKCIVIGENTPEWVIAWHSGFISGGITVPVDPNLPAREIREIVFQTKPSIVFCSKPFVTLFSELSSEFNFQTIIVVLSQSYEGPKQTFSSFCAAGDEWDNAFDLKCSPEKIAVVIFTSGTTGKAKGVMLCQRNFTAISLFAIPRMKVGAGDTMLAVLPLHHVFGACACLCGALGGGLDIVLIPSIKGSLILDGLREKHVSMFPAVPKMLSLFYNSIQQNIKAKGPLVRSLFALLTFISIVAGPIFGQKFRKKLFGAVHKNFGGKLDIIISGGAAIQKKYFNGFLRMGFNIVEGYGLSETFGSITLCPLGTPKLGSVGIPLAENEVMLANADIHGIGEVCFRGATVFPGYFNNPALTQKTFDTEGWFHTGDLGKIDKDGFIFLVGRIKDLIVLDSGKNVYPDELEEFYSASESIEEIGVFSAKMNEKEIAAALIVPSQEIRKNYSIPEAHEIIRNEILRLGRDLPSYKKITDFAVVYDQLPQTTTKKLKKHELREIYYSVKEDIEKAAKNKNAVSVVDQGIMGTAEYRFIASEVASHSKKSLQAQILPHYLLEIDLGLDSLKQLDLICAIEKKFHIVVPEDLLSRIATVGDAYLIVMELLATPSATNKNDSFGTIRQRILNGSAPHYPPRKATVIGKAIPQLVHAASSAFWNVSVTGNRELSADKPLVFCANRQGPLDVLWVLYSLPPAIRNKTFLIGTDEIVSQSQKSLFSNNIIPVKTSSDVVSILRLSISLLKDGNNLLVFPEATSTVTGELRKFKAGIGLLMLEINATIVPIRIQDAMDVWPKGGFPNVLRRKKIAPRITFGGQLTYQNLIALGKISPYYSAEQIALCIRDIIRSM